MEILRLSIASRLILLSLLPAIIIGYFVVNAVVQSQHKFQAYSDINNKISTLSVTNQLTNSFYYFIRAKQSANPHAILSQQFHQHINDLNTLSQQVSLLRERKGYQARISELRELHNELINAGQDEAYSLGHWGFEIFEGTVADVVAIINTTEDSAIAMAEKALIDLNLFIFWMQKEAWLSAELANDPTLFNELLPYFTQSVARQQLYLEQFIRLGASSAQVKILLEEFTTEQFQQGQILREKMLSGQVDKAVTAQYVANIDTRYGSLLPIINLFTADFQQQLQLQIDAQKRYILIIMVCTLLVIVFLAALGMSTSLRVKSKLNSILKTLSALGEKEDEIPQLVIDGHDEFTRFGLQLNHIITEQQQHNIDLLKAKEVAVAANRAKSAFLANMSHEIRTPLNGIIGMTEILSQSALTQSQTEVLSDLDTSSHALLALLNDILDLSKIESGNLTLVPQHADIREVVFSAVNMIQAKAVQKHIELVIDIDDALPEKVWVDDHRINQVLLNLLSNAAKFTEQGYIKTQVSYTQTSEGRELHFAISDTGAGIAPDKLDAIFDPFTQEDGSITRQFGGTGLGLAICTQLVQLMGGKISAQSTKSVGSCFMFSLPISQPSSSVEALVADTSAMDLPPSERMSLTGMSALLIDNASLYSPQLIKECHRFGLALTVVANIKEALNYQQPPDVVMYCQVTETILVADIAKLQTVFNKQQLLVCQHHLHKQSLAHLDLHTQVTLPFLGKRFKHALYQVTKQKNQYDAQQQREDETPNITYSLNRRILIVEDNLMNQKIASFFLEKAGYDYQITSNGQEAVDEITQGEQYDAILMDCMMPVMDGLTATKLIRQWEQQQKISPIPIIALTASVLDEDVKHCYESGMNAYLPKPYKSQQLLDLFSQLQLS